MIRTLLTLFLAAFMTVGVFAQSKKLVRYHKGLEKAEKYTPRHIEPKAGAQEFRNYVPTPPIGSRSVDAVTVVKVGEASNAFSTLSSEASPLSILNGVGDGGVVAFAYRQNIAKCFPSEDPLDNGRMRYSISTDGGLSWSIGEGAVVSADNPALQNQCFGIGPLTTNYTFRSRYPQAALSIPQGSTSLDDITLAVTSSTLDGQGGDWNGSAHITVQGAATASPTVTSETYDLARNDQNINGGLVERVSGEFWYASTEAISNDPIDHGDGTIFVYKGLLNSSTGVIDWTLNNELQPNHIVIPGSGATGPNYTTPNIAFGPDGQTGYISFAGDLIGGEDSTYSPVFIETQDGGNTWGDAVEINMNSFPEIRDSLEQFLILDSIGENENGGPIFDTVPFSSGKATLGFDHDLVVDANGNPHFLSIVGSSTVNPRFADGTNTGYSILSGIILMLFDITKDEFGDWNMMYVSKVNTFRAYFPLGVYPTDAASIPVDVHTQLSRSEDGSKIFMAWTDTDTLDANYEEQTIQADGQATINMTNVTPNLLTRAYDVSTNKITPIGNRTIDDQTWGGRILLPKVSPISLNPDGGDLFTMPVVFANIDGATAVLPTSYYYISDITFNGATDFTENPMFLFNCKSTPFANTTDVKAPACGDNNGSISIDGAGGTAPFSYTWEAIQGDSTVNIEAGNSVASLTSGIYKVSIVDDNGCSEEIIFNLDNEAAPALEIASSSDISCFGANDGKAEITVDGGTGDLTYAWSNGESTAMAEALPKGTATLTVTDANDCKSFISIEIDEPTQLEVASTISDVSCNGFTDGSVLARAQGGTFPYTYAWSNDATSAEVSGLSAGTYTLMLRDANDCLVMEEAIVAEPAPLTLTLTPFGANSNTEPPYNGVANLVPGGGTPIVGGGNEYRFIWCGDSSERWTVFNPELPGGPCEVTIIDGNGCTLSDTVVIEGITVNIIDPQLGINSLNVFPNPSTGTFNLELELSERDEVAIRVFDMQGKLVEAINLKQVMQYQSELNLSSRAEGVYLLSVTTSKGSTSQRIIVRR